jgi:hypothetical protein
MATGRKRKQGRRYVSGDLVREVETPPGAIRRLRDAALAGMADARWGAEIGRLYLAGRLTSEQYGAGCRWADLASRHSAALGSRAALASTSDFNRSRGTPIDPDSEVGVMEAKRHLKDLERYQKALVVIARHGVSVTQAVRRLCEEDLHLSMLEFGHALFGLNELAIHFGLTTQGKSGRDLGNR